MKTADEWHLIQRYFNQALELNQKEREVFIENLGAKNPSLAKEVATLLRCHYHPSGFIEASVQKEVRALLQSQVSSELPDVLGQFRIIRLLGQGGMGSVYQAEQESPRRKVALKVLFDAATPRAAARFKLEQRALASLRHDAIAQIYDAGIAEGVPYFAMEYIQGSTITAYCDEKVLTINDRLLLFQEVCEGMMHAHQKGIIHRDLKPDNILVSLQNNKSVPKIIDFGIVKFTQQQDPEHTLLGQVMGTPVYMSPEQAAGTVSQIDTRTDIYSLGAILYEMLCGCPVVDPDFLKDLDTPQMIEAVKIHRPQPFKVKLNGSHALDSICTNRCLNFETLKRKITGDLENIVFKCLSPIPDERYSGVNELIDDVARYLNNQPVKATAPGLWYRLRKLYARHKAVVLSMASLAIVIVLSLVVSFGLLNRANYQRKKAELARRATAEALAEKEGLVSFISEMIVSPHPDKDGGDVTLSELLRRIEAEIPSQFTGKPEATLLNLIGSSYFGMGFYGEAEQTLEKARLLFLATDPMSPEAGENLYLLGRLWSEKGDYNAAENLFEPMISEARPELRFKYKHALAIVLFKMNCFSESQDLYQELIIELREQGQIESEAYVQIISGMAKTLYNRGHHRDAQIYFQNAYDLRIKNGSSNTSASLASLNNWAYCFLEQGNFDIAADLFEDVLGSYGRIQKEDHPNTLSALSGLGMALGNIPGRAREGLAITQKAYQQRLEVSGPLHQHTLAAANTYALLLYGNDDIDGAIDVLENSAKPVLAKGMLDQKVELQLLNNLSYMLSQGRDIERALKIQKNVLKGYQSLLGVDARDTIDAGLTLVEIYFAREAWSDADRLLLELEAISRQSPPSKRYFVKLMGEYRAKLKARGR